jgi:hypothetical protein
MKRTTVEETQRLQGKRGISVRVAPLRLRKVAYSDEYQTCAVNALVHLLYDVCAPIHILYKSLQAQDFPESVPIGSPGLRRRNENK